MNTAKILKIMKDKKEEFDKKMQIFGTGSSAFGNGDSSANALSVPDPYYVDPNWFNRINDQTVRNGAGPWISTGTQQQQPLITPEEAKKIWESVSRPSGKIACYKGITFKFAFTEESLQVIYDLKEITKDEMLMIKVLSPDEFNGILKAWKLAYQDFTAEKEFFKGD